MKQTQVIRHLARTSKRGRMVAAAALATAAALSLAQQAHGQTVQPEGTQAVKTAPAHGGTTQLIQGDLTDGRIVMTTAGSRVITTERDYKRVSVSQPDIADVNLLGPRSILLTARKAGSTQLIVWDEQDRAQVVGVTVTADLDALKAQLKLMLPGSDIQVTSANGAIALRGTVSSLDVAKQAVQIAGPYSKQILDFLQVAGGQQVMLKVRFAEVSRTAERALGMNFGFSDGTFSFGSNAGGSALGMTGGAGAIPPTMAWSGGNTPSIFGSGKMGGTAFAYYLSALENNNLMRILAEPNLVAISGQQASFLAGGEIPVPVPQAGSGGNTVTIEYKEYGIRLNMVPVVLGDGRIRLKVAPEVSSLDNTNAVDINGYKVPALTTRKVDTTVELGEGQTFSIAGLFQNQVDAFRSSTPVLGDIPVLGALFRSVRYQKKQTELVVLVTPYLVSGMNPDQVPTLPGEHWRDPTSAQLYFDNDLGGPATRPTDQTPPATFVGEHGYAPAK